jgi:hypothetical protein
MASAAEQKVPLGLDGVKDAQFVGPSSYCQLFFVRQVLTPGFGHALIEGHLAKAVGSGVDGPAGLLSIVEHLAENSLNAEGDGPFSVLSLTRRSGAVNLAPFSGAVTGACD